MKKKDLDKVTLGQVAKAIEQIDKTKAIYLSLKEALDLIRAAVSISNK
jgi:hypothetical protein